MKEAAIVKAGVTGVQFAFSDDTVDVTVILGDGSELTKSFESDAAPDALTVVRDVVNGHLAPNQLERWTANGEEPESAGVIEPTTPAPSEPLKAARKRARK